MKKTFKSVFAFDGESRITECAAPSMEELNAAGGAVRAAFVSLLLAGADSTLATSTWPRALRSMQGQYRRLAALDVTALRNAWNGAQETRERKTAINANGLIQAAKDAGLIAKGNAPASKDETATSDLAYDIAKILSTGTPAQQIKAIRALTEIISAMDILAESEVKTS